MAVQFTQFVDPQQQTLTIAKVNTIAGKTKKTLSFPDGTVASLQPDGTMGFRPAGSAGGYELCDVDGQVAQWWYTAPDGKVVGPKAFAFLITTGKL